MWVINLFFALVTALMAYAIGSFIRPRYHRIVEIIGSIMLGSVIFLILSIITQGP